MLSFDKLWHALKKPWVITATSVFVVVCYSFIDKRVAYYFIDLNLGEQFPQLHWLTNIGSSKIYFVGLLVFAIVLKLTRFTRLAYKISFLWVCFTVPVAICYVLKIIFGRARPWLLPDDVYGFYWLQWTKPYFSFPSGHTTAVFALAIGLGVLLPRYFKIFLIIALLVALSRVLLTYHYISDVVTAAYLTVLELGTLFYLMRRYRWYSQIVNDNYLNFRA